jgi:hypothetical protein
MIPIFYQIFTEAFCRNGDDFFKTENIPELPAFWMCLCNKKHSRGAVLY